MKLRRHRAVTLGDVSEGFGLFLAWRSQGLVVLLLNSVLPKHSLLSDPGSSAQSWRFPHLVNERTQAVPRALQGWDGITTIPPRRGSHPSVASLGTAHRGREGEKSVSTDPARAPGAELGPPAAHAAGIRAVLPKKHIIIYNKDMGTVTFTADLMLIKTVSLPH